MERHTPAVRGTVLPKKAKNAQFSEQAHVVQWTQAAAGRKRDYAISFLSRSSPMPTTTWRMLYTSGDFLLPHLPHEGATRGGAARGMKWRCGYYRMERIYYRRKDHDEGDEQTRRKPHPGGNRQGSLISRRLFRNSSRPSRAPWHPSSPSRTGSFFQQ
jgi:hypothetical protein